MNSPLPTPSLDSMLFFFSNSLAVIASAAVLFFALGVLYGWFTWAKFKRRARAYQEETDLLRHEIARLKRHIADHAVTPSVQAASLAAPSAEPVAVGDAAAQEEVVEVPAPAVEEPQLRQESLSVAVLSHALHESHPLVPVAVPDEVITPAAPEPVAVATVVAEPPKLEAAPVAIAPVVVTPEPAVTPVVAVPAPEAVATVVALPVAAPVTIAPVVVTPEPAAATVVSVPAPEAVATVVAPPVAAPVAIAPEVATTESAIAPVVAMPEAAPISIAPAVAEPAPVVAVPEPIPAPIPEPPSLAVTAFSAELQEGVVQIDREIGVRYAARPERWDDLTLMRGVAEVLQHRLHDAGIYTFKQIATWSEDNIKVIDNRIHAKDRIARDRWVQQARDLHYLKYGEKIE